MKYLIRISFKSGNSIEHWFTKFKCTMGDANRKIEWTLADNTQSILFIDVMEIESIVIINKEE